MKVDLNADLGESYGNYKCGMDEEVIQFISSANIACGFHASDPVVMDKTVKLAKERGVGIGAHPGYPDLVGFGRRNMNISPGELKAMVQYQIGALKAFCDANKVKLEHIKPHGAMYNMAGRDEKLAFAIVEGIQEIDESLILLGLSGSKLIMAAQKIGLPCANEVFADRAYRQDGALVPRTEKGAVIFDEDFAVERVIKMIKENTVTTIEGREIKIEADSVCLHGDGEKAVIFAQKLKEKLTASGIEIISLKELLSHRR